MGQLQYWRDPNIYSIVRSIRYFKNCILDRTAMPITLVIDEVDAIIGSASALPFFAMLRNWHNERANPPWERLDLVLSISTDPHLLIRDATQLPLAA